MTNNIKNEKPLPGIKCDVSNCQYNIEGRKCTARGITVGPQYASTTADTVCDTFKPDHQATM